ncbi:MAG: FecCD family ABC transporter permease [Candidatus Limnocylindria bacterium]
MSSLDAALLEREEALAPRRGARRRAVLARWPSRSASLVLALGALVVCAFASVAHGSVEIGWGTVVSAFTSFDGSNEHIIVRELRVPRTLIGIGVGAALALTGALMQAVTRNPLADPGILGIESGAALAIVLAIFLLRVSSVSGYVWFAFLGAAATAVVVYLLGSVGREGATPVKLALAGAVMAAFLSSISSAILVLDVNTLDQFRFWVVGSLAGRDLGVFLDVLPFMAVGLVLALASGRALNTLSLGEEVARSLGQRVAFVRGLAALAVVLLAGSAVAAAGPIAFVGLAVPHAARILVGPDWRWILAYSVVLGPVLLLGADILGRIVARPAEVQVGIMTALVGAPVFVYIARRGKLAEL